MTAIVAGDVAVADASHVALRTVDCGRVSLQGMQASLYMEPVT